MTVFIPRYETFHLSYSESETAEMINNNLQEQIDNYNKELFNAFLYLYTVVIMISFFSAICISIFFNTFM